MNPELTPEELRELLGARALDALDPEEGAQVDAFLLSDASARAELHELEHAAAWLRHASLRPPAGVWDAIATEVARDLAADQQQGHRTDATTEPPPPTPLRGRPKPGHASRWLVAAAAVVVLVVGVASGFVLVDRWSSSDSITTKYQAARRDPSARLATLHSPDGEFSARAVVLGDGTGYVADASMPAIPASRDYQLWSITPDGPVSAGLLRGDRDVARFDAAAATTALAVTNEPLGGSRTPTGAPVMSGTLRSLTNDGGQ